MSERKQKESYENERKSFTYKGRTDPTKYFVQVYFSDFDPESNPKDVVMHDGIDYERTEDEIGIDWDSIPDNIKEDLADAALEDYLAFMNRPDAQAILDANKERLRREGSTLLDPRPTKREEPLK